MAKSRKPSDQGAQPEQGKSLDANRSLRRGVAKNQKQRVDKLLVERGLAPSRQRAQALIMAGKVHLENRRVEKPGQLVPTETALYVKGQDHPYVSRGGLKLAGALDAFGYDPSEKIVADFGASTGGFTDCLLQRGAKLVFAIDVGYGQLHQSLRTDPRVVVMERTNARHLEQLEQPVDLVVIDASFISLTNLLPAAKRVARAGASTIALVKPQFEVGPERVGRGGVVREQAHRNAAVEQVLRAAHELGMRLERQVDSSIRGPKGNHEILVELRHP